MSYVADMFGGLGQTGGIMSAGSCMLCICCVLFALIAAAVFLGPQLLEANPKFAAANMAMSAAAGPPATYQGGYSNPYAGMYQ